MIYKIHLGNPKNSTLKTDPFIVMTPRFLCGLYGSLCSAWPKDQMKSECIYEIIDIPKYHQIYLIDFYPESLFRLGMLCSMHSPE